MMILVVATVLWWDAACLQAISVNDAAELRAAAASASPGDVIELAAGTFQLQEAIMIPSGVSVIGAGMDQTIVTHADQWRASTVGLPDPEVRRQGFDETAYLFRLVDDGVGITIANMTLRGPHLHGAIFGWANERLHLHHLRIDDTMFSGVRTFGMKDSRIIDCQFIDAGGRWQRNRESNLGEPGIEGGITGGGIFAVWMVDSEIAHNRFERTQMGKADEFYGIKVRQAKRCRVHHNTINVNFSMEFPFENDEDVTIDHNFCVGTISIPKHAGGPVPESGRTFHIHHNVIRNSYAIEMTRNGVEINHNLFDFDTAKDHGNLISAFGKTPSPGPVEFHHNMIRNPGRGIMWFDSPIANVNVHHNHILTNTTATPRASGLFGFHQDSDHATIRITDNVIDCQGQSRPLLRHDKIDGITIENNRLVNVADLDRYENASTRQPTGVGAPLQFDCGVHDEFNVNGWLVSGLAE